MGTGSLLQLIHDAVGGWETFQAECRDWRLTQLGFEALLRAFQARGSIGLTRLP